MESTSDLKRAYETLRHKARRLDVLFRYYDGDHPSLYSSAKMAAEFAKLNVHFSENWCASVVDILLDRLNLVGFSADDPVQDALDDMWGAETLGVETDEVTGDVPVAGESYCIVWREDSGRVRWFHNDPRICHVWYADNDPHTKRMAAKMWDSDEDGKRHLTLYYPDAFCHYVSGPDSDSVTSEKAFTLEDEEANETGAVPVFHFRTRSRNPQGEVYRVLPVQRAINRLIDDMMAASEYGAFKQRWAVANADPSDMRAAPNTTMVLPPADKDEQAVSVGQFEASDLKNFGDEIDRLAAHVAALTRTPRSAFFSTGAEVSGDALIAMQAQLQMKARRYQERLGVTWSEAAAFALSLQGQQVRAQDIAPLWDEARIVQPIAEAEALSKLTAAGIPLVTALRRQGWSEDDIEKMHADAEEARVSSPGALSAPFLDAARRAMSAPPPAPGEAQPV